MTTSKKNTLITLVTLAVVTVVFLICQVGINTGAPWMTSTVPSQPPIRRKASSTFCRLNRSSSS